MTVAGLIGRPVRVRADLPTEICQGQFQVRLEPITADMFDQPRQVTLVLEKASEPIVPPLGCVVPPGGPVTQDLFLPMGCGIQHGDRLRWVLRDAVTGEILAEQETVSKIDLW